MTFFDDMWDLIHMNDEVNAIAKEEAKIAMGKATFWLVAAVAVIFLLGKISTMNSSTS